MSDDDKKFLRKVEKRLAVSKAEDVEGYPWYSEKEFLDMRLLPADAALAANCPTDLDRLLAMVHSRDAEIGRLKTSLRVATEALDRYANGTYDEFGPTDLEARQALAKIRGGK